MGASNRARPDAPNHWARRSDWDPLSSGAIEVLVVEAVSGEPVSAEFPAKQGKNREIPCIRPEAHRHLPPNRLFSQPFLAKFPSNKNRELSDRNREDLGGNRGFTILLGICGPLRLTGCAFEPLCRCR